MDIDEIKTKIINWVNNDNLAKFKVIDEGKYHPEKYPYLLKIETPSLGDLYIYKPKTYEDKISVYAGVDFVDEYKKAFDSLENNFKQKLLIDISNGITMMNLVIKFHPNAMNLEKIRFHEIIYFDGLTKDRIMNSFTKVLNAYGYVIVVLQKHNIIQKPFDPSNFV